MKETFKVGLLLSSLLFTQCKFRVSPYSADVPKILLNTGNIREIKEEEAVESDDYKVAFIADLHNYYEDLGDLISVINQDDYRFTIVGGDLTNLGLKEEFEATNSFLYRLNSPFIVAVGNHDLLANGKRIFARVYGPKDFSFEYKDALFVVFNSNNWETDGEVPDIEWVNAELAASSATFKVLVTHVSLQDSDRFTPSEVAAWKDLINTHNVDYVINGHDHNPGEEPFGTATQITIGAPSKRAFHELSFSPLGVTHQKKNF